MKRKNKKILFIVNYLSFFITHRLQIAETLIEKGFEVFIGYGELRGADIKILVNKGIKLSFIPMQPGSINFIKDLKTLYKIWSCFKKIKPDIIHLITIKPYLYGGIISRFTDSPCLVSSVTGLGTLFVSTNLKIKFLRIFLYPFFKFAFSHFNQKVILQNEEDINEFVKWGVLDHSKVELIKGSGVDLKNFRDHDKSSIITRVCFAARLIKDKGVYEFVSAAKLLKERGVKAQFLLAGDLDKNNPTGLNIIDLKKIINDGHVKFIGYQKDISKLYANSDIVCLPSYREGFPKSLIEAAAASRPIVTTDVAGCRDSIIPNKTGLLVQKKNHIELANAIQWLIENPKKRIEMGKAGRKLAEKKFSVKIVVKKHLKIYKNLLTNFK